MNVSYLCIHGLLGKKNKRRQTFVQKKQKVKSLEPRTVTKECHPGRECRCDCPSHTADSNVSSNTQV